MKLDEAKKILEDNYSIIHVGPKLLIDMDDWNRVVTTKLDDAIDKIADEIKKQYTVWFPEKRPVLEDQLHNALADYIREHIEKFM